MSRKRSSTKSIVNTVSPSNNVEIYTLVQECRVCLQAVDTKSARNMLLPWKDNWRSSEPTMAQGFEKVTNIKISPTDDHTKFICQQCLMKLKICIQFIQMAQYSDDILHKRCTSFEEPMVNSPTKPMWPKPIRIDKVVDDDILHKRYTSFEEPMVNSPSKPLWPKPIQINKVIGADNLEVEIKQEVLSDDENVMETEDLDHDEPRMDIKVEPEEYQQYKEIHMHGIFSPNNITQINGGQDIDNNVDLVDIKQEPLSDQEDVEMTPDMPLDCMLCMKTFNSVSGLKAHVIAQHSYITIDRKTESKKEMFSCTTCRRNFFTNTDLIVHETCHYKHACYMCNNKFDTFAQLTKHRKKCPKNKEGVTRVKTLEDVRRPSPEPQQLLEDKEIKQLQNLPETDKIDSTNIQLESHLEISNRFESNSMEIDNEQENSIEQTKIDDVEVEHTKINDIEVEQTKINDIEVEQTKINDNEVEQTKINDIEVEQTKINDIEVEQTKINDIEVEQTSVNIEHTEVNDKEVPNEQMPELNSLVPHSVDLEQNNYNIEPHTHETDKIHFNEHILEANNSIEDLNLELNSSQSDTSGKSNDIEMTSKTSNLEVTSNSEQISAEDNNGLNIEPFLRIELISKETDEPIEISGDIEKETVTTTVVIGNTNSKLHVKSNSRNSQPVELNSESRPNEEAYNSHPKPDSPQSENNSIETENENVDTEYKCPDTENNNPDTETKSPDTGSNSPDTENNSRDTEITSLQTKSDCTNPEIDSSVNPNLEVSLDLEAKNSRTELNPELNTSIELSSIASESANDSKPEEKSSGNDSTAKEVDSDMKIHLEIHSIDKKVTMDKESEIKGVDSVELNKDRVRLESE